MSEYLVSRLREWNRQYSGKMPEDIVAAADLIESLRQQLSAMTAERDKAKAMPMRYRRMEFNAQLQNENESLHQQLADMQETLKDHGEIQVSLCQQLAERDADVKLLREPLIRIDEVAKTSKTIISVAAATWKMLDKIRTALDATEPKP